MQTTLWRPSDIVNSDNGNEADAPKRRGRIPHSAWPQILQRHRAGATLSELAREFDCTPSAISYIVRKAEAMERRPAEEPAQERLAQGAGEPDDATGNPAESREPMSEARLDQKRPAAEISPAPGRVPVSAGGGTAATVPVAVQPAAAETAAPADVRRPETASPIDTFEARLREAAQICVGAYRTWRQQPSESTEQGLRDTVHEMRKALARIEIEMSAGRREERALKPIPIPAHRSSRRPR